MNYVCVVFSSKLIFMSRNGDLSLYCNHPSVVETVVVTVLA